MAVPAILRAIAIVAGALLVGMTSPSETGGASVADIPRPAQLGDGATTAIECGGYDEQGRLVNGEAAAITHVPVGPDGVPTIPSICGGYTQDGTFIGDL